MRVICIDDTVKRHPRCTGKFIVKQWESYTVTGIVNWYGKDWYLLAEDPFGYGWNPECFLPISNISETEMIRNYKMQPA